VALNEPEYCESSSRENEVSPIFSEKAIGSGIESFEFPPPPPHANNKNIRGNDKYLFTEKL
jgi:hypothetical protein